MRMGSFPYRVQYTLTCSICGVTDSTQEAQYDEYGDRVALPQVPQHWGAVAGLLVCPAHTTVELVCDGTRIWGYRQNMAAPLPGKDEACPHTSP